MKRPGTAAIVVFLGIVLVVGLIAAVVWTSTDGPAAIEIGDTSVSRQDFNDELREWAQFGDGRLLTAPGAIDSGAGAEVATRVVWSELASRYLDRVGEGVTDEDRQQIVATGGSDLRRAPQWFQDQVVDREAAFVALTRAVGGDATGEAQSQVLRREARRTAVSVDPAYGRWAPTQVRVVPFPATLATDG